MVVEATSFLANLAELSPNIIRYIDDQQLEIDIEAIIGTEEFHLGHSTLRIKIKNFYLRLISASLSVINGSRYALKLQKFNIDATETTSRHDKTSLFGKAEAAAGAKAEAWLPSVIAKFSTEGILSRDSDKAKIVEDKITKEIMLITPLPNKTWLVGHEEFGDIRKADGNLVGSYFQEARESGLNEPSPLCRIRLAGTSSEFDLILALIVKTKDFRFEIIDRWGQKERDALRSEKEEFEQRMKARIAGIVVQKSIRETVMQNIQSELKGDELLICFGRLTSDDITKSMSASET
jgi:hypothetical protein